MSNIDVKMPAEKDHSATVRAAELPSQSVPARRWPLLVRLLITLVTVAAAIALDWVMWTAYMGAPWTRDGTVRAYVVTMAPEVVGRIVALPVRDNQFVHKGDLLMVIDQTDYKIAVDLEGGRDADSGRGRKR